MKTPVKILIVGALAALVAVVVTFKERGSHESAQLPDPTITSARTEIVSHEVTPQPAAVTAKLPRLVDLGAEKCIPCRMMAPILAELKRDYSSQFTTDFIDVWKNPDAGKQYGVEMIPTQIFYDAEGQEQFRHVGFIGKEDILAKWKQLGINLDGNMGTSAD